jgi:RNA polymerase sigma-70 factor (ECF subfamily)
MTEDGSHAIAGAAAMTRGILSRLRARTPARDLAAAAGGDVAAFDRIYDEHVDALYAFVYFRVGRDVSLAEDAVQETLASALRRHAEFDPARGPMGAWLTTLSRNVVRDLLRSHRRGSDLAAAWERIDHSLAQIYGAMASAPLPGEVLAREETRDLVQMAIANLPDTYRRAIARTYIDGQTVPQLAAELGLSVDAAKSQLARARRAFRDAFETLAAHHVEPAV